MPSTRKRTISLPAEHADYIDTLVSAGAYASASEVVRAGLRALQERDDAVERWLRHEVAATYDSLRTDPAGLSPATEVRDRLRARHAARTKGAS
jgi:antitoxin ParD1/3/4